MVADIEHPVVIVIPVYKEDPEPYEVASLRQCNQVLSGYEKIYLRPESVDLSIYLGINPGSDIAYEDSHFKSRESYNKLMLSEDFYRQFAAFEYILIYQPDAYVFRDELMDWVEKGYSYIGAPFRRVDLGKELWLTGNGGFSLRRVSDFLKVLQSNKNVRSYPELLKEYKRKKKTLTFSDYFKGSLKTLGYKNKNQYFLHEVFPKLPFNEDYYWSYYAPMMDKTFKVPPANEAIKFAFERDPERFYELNGEKFPFGCHAWQREQNYSFWKEFIQIEDTEKM